MKVQKLDNNFMPENGSRSNARHWQSEPNSLMIPTLWLWNSRTTEFSQPMLIRYKIATHSYVLKATPEMTHDGARSQSYPSDTIRTTFQPIVCFVRHRSFGIYASHVCLIRACGERRQNALCLGDLSNSARIG